MSDQPAYVMLHELLPDHRLRNVPMKELGVELRHKGKKNWIKIKTWMIGNVTYNQLGKVWTDYDEFRVPMSEL